MKKSYKLVGDTPLQLDGKLHKEDDGDPIVAEEEIVAHLVASGRLIDLDEEPVVVLMGTSALPDPIVFADDLSVSQEMLIDFMQGQAPIPPEEWNKLTDEQRAEGLNLAVQFVTAVLEASKANKGKKPTIKSVQGLLKDHGEIKGPDIDAVWTWLESLTEPAKE